MEDLIFILIAFASGIALYYIMDAIIQNRVVESSNTVVERLKAEISKLKEEFNHSEPKVLTIPEESVMKSLRPYTCYTASDDKEEIKDIINRCKFKVEAYISFSVNHLSTETFQISMGISILIGSLVEDTRDTVTSHALKNKIIILFENQVETYEVFEKLKSMLEISTKGGEFKENEITLSEGIHVNLIDLQ